MSFSSPELRASRLADRVGRDSPGSGQSSQGFLCLLFPSTPIPFPFPSESFLKEKHLGNI